MRMDGTTISFDDICKAESKIDDLYRLAKMISRKPGKTFCANLVWYELFKPQLRKVVGWGRTDYRRRVEKKAKKLGQEGSQWLVTTDEGFNFHEIGPGDPMFKHRWLESEEAYDMAYDHVYNALPDCRDCGCL